MEKLRELIFIALGEASVCWKNRDILNEAGEFDSTQATRIGEQLIKDIVWPLESNSDGTCQDHTDSE